MNFENVFLLTSGIAILLAIFSLSSIVFLLISLVEEWKAKKNHKRIMDRVRKG